MVRKLLPLLLILFGLRAFSQTPVISSFSPASGAVGTTVTISGSGFDAAAGNNIVFFGGVKATVSAASTGSITTVAPAGSQNLPVTVINLTTGLQGISAMPYYTTFTENGTNAFTSGSFSKASFEDSEAGLVSWFHLTDVDNDGKTDLLIVNAFNQTINIYRNTAINSMLNSGSLTLAATLSVTPNYLAYGPRGVKMADLDGDGKQDIVVPYLEQRKIGIYKNNTNPGDISRASFGSEIQVGVGSDPRWVSIADLNGDGKPEIITANGAGANLSILRNIGTKGNLSAATFAAGQELSLSHLGTSPNSVEAADLDGDRKADLLVGMADGLTIFRNTTPSASGLLSFSSVGVPVAPGAIIGYPVDMDGDGKYDILAHNYNKEGVFVLRNTTSAAGNITLGPQVKLATKYTIESLQFGDLNGDTRPEIITAPDGGEATVFINNNASGNITPTAFGAEIIIGQYSPGRLTAGIGDIDGDGKPDIVSKNGYTTVTLFHNEIIGNPQITGFSPASAGPGEVVSITGKGLNRIREVTFGGTPASSFNVLSPTNIRAVVNRGSTGQIVVANYEGRDSIPGFTYTGPPPPVINSFSPTSGDEGTVITIRGANFNNSFPIVRIGGLAPRSISSYTASSIELVIDTGATGAITVSNIDGTASLGGFTYTPRPQIYSLDKPGAAKGETVTIKGKYLANTTSITLGGVPAASFTQVSPTTVTFVMGDGETGDLVLKTIYGQASVLFKYNLPPPLITSVSTMKAPAGANVTITGANFSILPEKNFVYFGTVKAKVTAATSTSLTVEVPTGAIYAPIYLTTHNYTIFTDERFILSFAGGGKIDAATFGARTDFYAGDNVNSLNIMDINADGQADVITPSHGYYNVGGLVNNSRKGEFKLVFNGLGVGNSGNPEYAVPVDFDNDGYLDISVLTQDATRYRLHNLLGNFFTKDNVFTGGYYSNGLVAGDMNNDGKTEVLLFGGEGRAYLVDVDGDHKLDYLKAGEKSVVLKRNITPPGNPDIVVAEPEIIYEPEIELALTAPATRLAIGDFDGDGKQDIAAIRAAGGDTTASMVIFRNSSTSGKIAFNEVLTLPPVVKRINNPMACTAADVDGDGLIDLLYSANGIVAVYKNTGRPGAIAFAPKVEYAADGSVDLAVADFDGDGQPDITGIGNNPFGGQAFILRNLTGTIPVTNIQPFYGPAGTTITITGAGFTGATSVKLGGYTLKNYKIISDKTITAVVDSTVSGYATITTAGNAGTSLTKYYTADAPVITPADTVTILQGDSILLSSAPKMGYYSEGGYLNELSGGYYVTNYQWTKDGKDILNARQPGYKVGGAGVYTLDLPLLPSGRISSNKVVVVITPKLPPNTFLVSATGATCKGTANGSITIMAKTAISCTIAITAPGYNYSGKLSTRLAVNDLAAGTYSVCIKPDARPDLQQCYTLVIAEPKDITLYDVVSRDKKTVTLTLSGGDTYNIQLNGVLHATRDSVVKLPLTVGANRLVITSDKLCQGIIDKIINANPAAFPYPNPIDRVLNINLGMQAVATARVEIYSVMGVLVYSASFKQPGSILQMDISSIKLTGTYVLKLTTDNQPQQIFNIIKR